MLASAALRLKRPHRRGRVGRVSKYLPGAAVLLWLGVMAFFAFMVAPAAFSALDRPSAGRLVTALLPAVYRTGLVLGALALAGILVRGRWERAGARLDWLALGLLLVMLALTSYAMLSLMPRTEAAYVAMGGAGVATGAAAPDARTFAQLHHESRVANGVVLVAGVLFLVVEAVRARR